MTVNEILLSGKQVLERAHNPNPWLDAELLLAHVLDKPRAYLIAHQYDSLTHLAIEQFNHLTIQRSLGEPLAYLKGEKEFFGRSFFVTPDVLVPRPATEELITHIIKYISTTTDLSPVSSGKTLRRPSEHGPRQWRGQTAEAEHTDSQESGMRVVPTGDKNIFILDIGTGSGCVAITLAAIFPHAEIIATDISHKALDIAQKNAARHHVNNQITFLQGNLLTPIIQQYGQFMNCPYHWIIVANLPYIPAQILKSSAELSYEPQNALNGGVDGCVLYRQLCDMLSRAITTRTLPLPSAIFLEADHTAMPALREYLTNHPLADIYALEYHNTTVIFLLRR